MVIKALTSLSESPLRTKKRSTQKATLKETNILTSHFVLIILSNSIPFYFQVKTSSKHNKEGNLGAAAAKWEISSKLKSDFLRH